MAWMASTNYWLDCLVGCAVAASMQGATLFETNVNPTPRKRIRLSAGLAEDPTMKDSTDSKIELDEQHGHRCPKCGYGHFRVIYTRATWGCRVVHQRKCRQCGERHTICERIVR